MARPPPSRVPASAPLHRRPLRGRLTALLAGAHPVLPRPVDALAERWARLPPRVRTLAVVTVLAAAALSVHGRIQSADERWGGQPVGVLVAERDLGVGDPAVSLRKFHLPPAAVPPGALDQLPAGTHLALALPEGAVLTRGHLDPRGPAAGLGADLRALPIPVEAGWGVVAGGWVDVWVLGGRDDPAELVAASRPVLEVRGDDYDGTALVGLASEEVAAATEGLAVGRVLLTHAPPPDEAASVAPDGG